MEVHPNRAGMSDAHAHALPALSHQAAARPVTAWHPSQLEPLLGLHMGSASPSQSSTRNQAQMLSTLQALISRGGDGARSMQSAGQGSLIASTGAGANLAAAGIGVPDSLGATGMAWPLAPAQQPISQLQSAGPWCGNNALLSAGFLGQTPLRLQPSHGFGEAGNGHWGNAVNTTMMPGWHAYSASVGKLPAGSLAGQVAANVGFPPQFGCGQQVPSNSSCLPYQANAHIAHVPEGVSLAGGDGDVLLKRKFGLSSPGGAFAQVWAPDQLISLGQSSKRVKQDTSMMSASSGAAGGNACRMARARQKQGGKWQKEAAQFKTENGVAGNPVRKEPNQVIAFRNFLLGEERKQLLRLSPASTANDPQNPLGFSVIQILGESPADAEASTGLWLPLNADGFCPWCVGRRRCMVGASKGVV